MLKRCGTQVDIRDFEIRTCSSVAIQVEPNDFQAVKEITKHSDALPLLTTQPSSEEFVEKANPTEYRCDYCCGCLFCEKGHAWYSIRGKACFWVLLLTPGYLILGVFLLPFFFLMGIAYCVAAAIE
ncbi:uncharacterized protein LOC111327729 isoform X2 [Stylophora pistillata]|uniref:uncharacterized protein LOC111327729 isoform X2 n=1 Tax=Stylophora pistillata TaxID=50429 RepID=UPI000C04F3B4|nr:uncharacterized protein LOC111327729 isoform X2 [Stylophora pistillata]